MKDEDEIIFTVRNTDFKISKDGGIQVRANQGIAVVEKGFKIKQGKKSVELGANFTTNSAAWVDITGLPLTKKQKSFLKELRTFFLEHRSDWYSMVSLILQFFKQ